jgi:uncharacterized protein (DUF1499 family)
MEKKTYLFIHVLLLFQCVKNLDLRNYKIPKTIREINRLAAAQTLSLLSMALVKPIKSSASVDTADSVGVDQNGLFALCPESKLISSCVSSQDDRPTYFLPPWCYDSSTYDAKKQLIEKIMKIDGSVIRNIPTMNSDRYISVEFQTNGDEIDDAEFYFTPNDNTVQFRSLRRGNRLDFGANRNRIEALRQSLGFESVPVLRNRRRVLVFLESPFDTFGPPTIGFEKSIDNISDDMMYSNGVYGELDPLAPVWEKSSKR